MRHFLGSRNMLLFVKFLDCSANFTVRSCSNVVYTCNVVNNLYLHKAIPVSKTNKINNFIAIVARQLHYMRHCNAESKLRLFEFSQTAGYRKTIANYKHSDRKSSKCPCAKPRPKIHRHIQLPKKKLSQSLDHPKNQNMKRGSTLGGKIFVPTPHPNSRSYSVDYQRHSDKICASNPYPLIHSYSFSSRFVGHCLFDTVNIVLQPSNQARNISNCLWYMSLRRFSNNADDTNLLERGNNNSGGSKTNVRNSKHKMKSTRTVLLREKRNYSMPLKFTSNEIKNSMFSDLPRTLVSRGPKSKVASVDSIHSNEPRKDLLSINTNLYKGIKIQNDGAKAAIDNISQTDGIDLILASKSSVECSAKRVWQSCASQTIHPSKDTDATSSAELKPEKRVNKLHCSKLETSDVGKLSSEHVKQNQPNLLKPSILHLSGKSQVLEDNKKPTTNEELNRFDKIKEATSGLAKEENDFQNIAKTIPVEKLTLKFPAPMQILFEEVPLPPINDKEVLIKMDTVGICSSDVHMYETGLTNYNGEEIPLGHEGSGTIIQVGSNVKHLKFGDKIAIDPTKSCGECTFCYLGRKNLCQNAKFSGVLSNYVVHSGNCCHKLPLGVTYEQGALAHPLALAIHACRQGGVVLGSKVLIIGACPVGLSAAMSAMVMGAKDVAVVDTEETNLKIAKRVGAVPIQIATNMSTEEKCQKLSSQLNCRPDIIIDSCGSTKSIDLSTNVLRPGGVNVIVGCQEENPRFPVLASLVKELNIKTSFRSNNTYSLALEIIRCGSAGVEKLITHRFEFSKAKVAFDTALNETKCNALKVVLKFPKDV